MPAVLQPEPPVTAESLEDSIRRVIRGEAVLAPRALSALVDLLNRNPDALRATGPLSMREQQVLTYVASGCLNKEIGGALGIADGTVHTHLRHIRNKLRVPRKRAAVRKLLDSAVSPPLNLRGGPELKTTFPKSSLELRRRFATEEACRQYLFDLRWGEGFECPDCRGKRAWRTRRHLWICAACRRQVSVTAGTILHETRIPLRVWFRALWQLTAEGRMPTIRTVIGALRTHSYKTAWAWRHRLNRCLDEINDRDQHTSGRRGERFQALLQRIMQMPRRHSRKQFSPVPKRARLSRGDTSGKNN